MLQQTQVSRVVPQYLRWLERWPTPTHLAATPAAEVIVAWGRLGYPRRALRLHQAAMAIEADHDDVVPADYDALIALPGVGDYTANAVLAFSYRQRVAVLDTNVRRVLARVLDGVAQSPSSAPTKAERTRALGLLPADPETAATLSEAFMEFGALVCTAKAPACDECPLQRQCAWFLADRPAATDAVRRQPRYAGSDRQVRGLILGLLRERDDGASLSELDGLWGDSQQLCRARDSLLADGLIRMHDDRVSL